MAVVVAGTIQGKAGKPGKAGKAGKTGPGQTKPRLGTTGKPAKPKQGFLIILFGGGGIFQGDPPAPHTNNYEERVR